MTYMPVISKKLLWFSKFIHSQTCLKGSKSELLCFCLFKTAFVSESILEVLNFFNISTNVRQQWVYFLLVYTLRKNSVDPTINHIIKIQDTFVCMCDPRCLWCKQYGWCHGLREAKTCTFNVHWWIVWWKEAGNHQSNSRIYIGKDATKRNIFISNRGFRFDSEIAKLGPISIAFMFRVDNVSVSVETCLSIYSQTCYREHLYIKNSCLLRPPI